MSGVSLLDKIKRKISSWRWSHRQDFSLKSSHSLGVQPWLNLFDAKWYLQQYPDVRDSGMSPLQHYCDYGRNEGRNPNYFFDIQWYLEQYPDVQKSGMNALQHFWEIGAKEGRNPSSQFNTRAYLYENKDVQLSGTNPLQHYLEYGLSEGRSLGWGSKIENNSLENFLAPYKEFFAKVSDTDFEVNLVANYISFPKSSNPLVSIIIPVYENFPYTLQCLYSICRQFSFEFEIEVIVVDDCSPDNSGDIFNKISGVKYIHNQVNLGFLRSCNAGAGIASGKFLCFLNNDTIVFSGWLEELVRTFKNMPGTGLVGSKLIYPNGQLQEAGGIVWQDASAWNYGRYQNPDYPEFNYAREVDYCSGASIAIPTDLFMQLNGFDEIYAPAYYEDTDIAFKVRSAGYRVIYQPLSKILHFEGISSGTELKEGIKAYQVVNQKTFLLQWKNRLATHQPIGVDIDGSKDRRFTKRALYIDASTPTPDKDSGSIDAFNHMLMLREMGFQITFSAEENLVFDGRYTENLQRNGIEVIYRPYTPSIEDHLRKFGKRYDFVMICRPLTGERVIDLVKKWCTKAKILYHTVDIHFLRLEREANLFGSQEKLLESHQVRLQEEALMLKADMTSVVSQYEFEYFSTNLLLSNKIYLLPFVRATNQMTEALFKQRSNILFVGAYNHYPNIDAAVFLANEIMPLLRASGLGINLILAGSNPTDLIRSLSTNDIKVVGYIERLGPLLNQSRLMVAPLRFGAGIKGKVGSAMLAGLPVVASSLAAEGMGVVSNEHLIIADNAQETAEAIITLYSDEKLWGTLRRNAYEFAESQWGIEHGYINFSRLIKDLGLIPSPPPYALSCYSEE